MVIFEAVYSTGNISRAAERLAMSQPAVSNALARLRELVDDPLFIRAPRGVEPTVKAREMIGPVRDALGLIGRQLGAETDIDLAIYKRAFRIITVDFLEALMMPAVISTVLNQAPGITIECVQGRPNSFEDIRSGQIDLACFPFPYDSTEMVVKPIAPTSIVVMTRRDHPGVKKPLDLETFERLPHIALNHELRSLGGIDKELIALGISRRIVYMVAKVWSMPPVIERTDLVGLLPRRFANDILNNYDVEIHELPAEIPEQHTYMMWHTNNDHDPGHRWLRESMIQAIRTNQ
jgi:DNA-binding transcriptional LysR family regulator